jgi:tetratricopeptide (TPR) repeat protein
MGRMRPSLILLGCLLSTLLFAQDDELPPDEVADLVDRYVERGMESLREGSYEEARLRFRKAIKRDPKNRLARLGIAASFRALGAYDKAEAALKELMAQHPGDRTGKLALAELDLRRGRTSDARKRLKEVIATGGEGPDLDGLRARYRLGEALARDGMRDEARDVLDDMVKHYDRRYEALADAAFNASELRSDVEKARPLSEEMTLVASALRLYVDLSPLDHDYANSASELLGYARELDPDNWEAWIEWVRVSRVERLGAIARARKVMEIVTPRNPELADLYVEVAKSVLVHFNEGEARSHAETALKINPKQTDARVIVARILLEDNQYADATDHIEQGLKVDPRHRDLLALKATLDLLTGDKEGFEKGMKRMLEVDPTYGEGYHLAGLVIASRQRRYDRGVKLVRKALRLDPMNFQAHATLGMFLANLGRGEQARDALKKSQELFPFSHPIRRNFLTVLDYVLGTMVEQKSEHFVIRYDPSEFEILSQFLPELLEACWADMVKRYGFEPKAPILVEVFKSQSDFSARTLGIPIIPALGACFGGLITLDSPQALPPGRFQWASTARHEFGHVMSLQLSEGQVPRWFTEGLSVLEERPLDIGWGQDEAYERQVYDAWKTDTLPKIATFDSMFRTARVAYAYYAGGLMLQFLEERSGEAGIVKALRLYGEDRPMREVFKEAFDLELKEFDRLFRDFVGRRMSRYRRVPNYNLILQDLRAQALRDPKDSETLLKIAWAHYQMRSYVDAGAYLDRAQRALDGKEHSLAQLLDANLSLRAGRREKAQALLERYFAAGGEDYDARMLMASFFTEPEQQERMVAELKKAKAAWPVRVSGTNPYTILRRHYLSEGREDDALKEIEEQARIASKEIGMRLLLAREYTRRGRDADAVEALEQALRITLFDTRIHGALLPHYRKAGDHKKAIRAARCRVALRDEKDEDEAVAERWLDLVEVYLEAGEKEKAVTAYKEAAKLADAEALPRIADLKEKLGQ